VDVQQLRPGLWRWTANHPDWTAEEDWPQEVASYYYEAPDAVLLIDPLVPGDDADRFYEHLDADVKRAARPVAILLSIFWHHRSSPELAERYDATIWMDARQFQRLVDRVPAERLEEYEVGATLPGGVQTIAAGRKNDVVFWIPAIKALAAGDILLGTGDGGVTVCPDSWLGPEDPTEVRASLQALLELPVELLLVGHGGAVVDDAHAALERALA
jgi:glyoxylase-like metal-dependent hydrolase (beta-lactamase superfamily II)